MFGWRKIPDRWADVGFTLWKQTASHSRFVVVSQTRKLISFKKPSSISLIRLLKCLCLFYCHFGKRKPISEPTSTFLYIFAYCFFEVSLIQNRFRILTWISETRDPRFLQNEWLEGPTNIFRTQYIKLATQEMNLVAQHPPDNILEPKNDGCP